MAFGVAMSAQAAGFWKGTGQDSGNADNWSNSQAFMGGDNFYIRDTRMTDTAHRRDMTLTASPNDTTGHLLFFQCGTEDDPFVVDGNGQTVTMAYVNTTDTGLMYIGANKNHDNESAVGSAVLNGGTWKPSGFVIGGGSTYTGYLKLNGTTLTTTSNNSNCYNHLYNGKVVCVNSTVSLKRRIYVCNVSGGHGEYYHIDSTLTDDEYIVVGAFSESSNGKGYAYMEVDGGLVTNKSQRIILGDNGAPGDQSIMNIKNGIVAANQDMFLGNAAAGTLIMNGGELDVSRGNLKLCNATTCKSGEDCYLVMSNGVVKAKEISYGSGSANATILFDGGTLQAAADGTLIVANNKLTVSVGAGGGVIDANNKAVTIAEDIGGTGCLAFMGGGTTTLSGNVSYSGGTKIELGTKIIATTADAKNAVLGNLALTGDVADGDYYVFEYSGLTDEDLAGATITHGGASGTTITRDGDQVKVHYVAPVGLGWNGGDAAWATADAWTNATGTATTWGDGNYAVFEDSSTVSLGADATAASATFNADATIAAGGGTLTVPVVMVASGVAATISAPTAGALEKTGAGTLTLGTSRTDQTAVAEGTLAMADGATVDIAKLTLGVDAAKSSLT